MEIEEHPHSITFVQCRQRTLGQLSSTQQTHHWNDDHLTSKISWYLSLFHLLVPLQDYIQLYHGSAGNSLIYSKPHVYVLESRSSLAVLLKTCIVKINLFICVTGFWEICSPFQRPSYVSETHFHYISHHTTYLNNLTTHKIQLKLTTSATKKSYQTLLKINVSLKICFLGLKLCPLRFLNKIQPL